MFVEYVAAWVPAAGIAERTPAVSHGTAQVCRVSRSPGGSTAASLRAASHPGSRSVIITLTIFKLCVSFCNCSAVVEMTKVYTFTLFYDKGPMGVMPTVVNGLPEAATASAVSPASTLPKPNWDNSSQRQLIKLDGFASFVSLYIDGPHRFTNAFQLWQTVWLLMYVVVRLYRDVGCVCIALLSLLWLMFHLWIRATIFVDNQCIDLFLFVAVTSVGYFVLKFKCKCLLIWMWIK